MSLNAESALGFFANSDSFNHVQRHLLTNPVLCIVAESGLQCLAIRTVQHKLPFRLLEFNRDLLKRVEKLEEMVEAGDRREQALEGRVAELAGAITRLESENQSLRARCKKLEGENAELREEVGGN